MKKPRELKEEEEENRKPGQSGTIPCRTGEKNVKVPEKILKSQNAQFG